MPTFMWSENADEDDLTEFDSCTLCGKATSLLLYLRIDELLAGVCRDCVSGINTAYREMLRRRSQKATVGRGSFT